MDDEPVISYGLKEILGDISHKLDTALGLIHGKADAVRVDEMDARLRLVESHIDFAQKSRSARSHYREWVIPTLITLALTVATILQLMHS